MSTDTTQGRPTEAPEDQNQGVSGVVLFVITSVLLLAGFWLMGEGATKDSFGAGAGLFGGGLIACTLAYLIPMSLRSR
ncbi:hypothetical protein CLV28_2708 [Sediminihabitans luteus]|uniref:Uncharacterized protein n=1 Tax=Sediminihabitans luteus TaxID=1138585 RepID=A0A2M9CCX8_9CELL|nr:hypothetical protein [Sediminihabitans luteus]PJJ69245.1 hypothetical protein CLV28_2708 [Sediminihabitans luteus]GII98921.1 hypothetical protein Slu03_12990 [Sediminihabitans luteus]